MPFQCPECRANMNIEETLGGRMHVSCCKCSLEDTVPYNSNQDEAFLEFLHRYDENMQAHEPSAAVQTTAPSHNTNNITPSQHNDIVRSEEEIKKMIGDEKPDEITQSVLYSKKDYLADYRVIRESEPEYGQSSDKAGLNALLAKALQRIGVKRFYKFQHAAIKNILSGNDTIIEAPTASGKTEAFLVPVVQNIIDLETRVIKDHNTYTTRHGHAGKGKTSRRQVHAIFVYPTKALARDQLPKIQNMAKAAQLTAAVLDGDTDETARSRIMRNPPHILVTNFDLLHHQMWRQTRLSKIFHTVRILVVDEAHTYSGIFGSNVHYVIKRLERIANTGKLDKKRIQYVASSATLNNAEKFCKELFGIGKITHIRGSGPSRHIEFAMLFPSLRKPRVLMADLTKKFATSGHQTMAFSNSHRSAELLAIRCQKSKMNISVHRAGLMPTRRMITEKKFKSGELQAISCTPTLELGIDVGSTDCIVSAPTPINRLIQRIGRAARKGKRHGYAFLALGNDPISQYYKNHPADYFVDVEQLFIDPRNPYIEERQILAMAHDAPIRHEESTKYADVIERLVLRGDLKRNNTGIVPNRTSQASHNQTLANYSIRGMGESVDIVYDGAKVGDRVCPIALDELHQGAVYFLAGRSYMVAKFDYPKTQHALIERLPFDHPYYTKALTLEHPSIEEIMDKRMVNGIETAFCKLRIEKIVSGYAKIKWKDTHDVMQEHDYSRNSADEAVTDEMSSSDIVQLDEPLFYTYVTKGIVFCAPHPSDEVQNAKIKMTTAQQQPTVQQDLEFSYGVRPPINKCDEKYITASGYHATEHVVIEGSNMITGGASQNLGGISMGTSGIIFIHDGVIGGSGASKALYDRLELTFERCMHIVGECPCTAESGCPRCIMSYRCGNNNQYLHKMSALEILKRINGGESTTLELDSLKNQKPIV